MWKRGTILSLIAWAASIKKFIPKNTAECRLNGLNFPITSLLSILIASYYSIKRLVLENVFSLIFDH